MVSLPAKSPALSTEKPPTDPLQYPHRLQTSQNPPQNLVSFKDTFLLNSAGDDMDMEDEFQRDDEELTNYSENPTDKIPTIKLSQELKARIRKPWKRSLIIKLVGADFSLQRIMPRLIGIWRPKGKIETIDLPNGFCTLKFPSEEDYRKALEQSMVYRNKLLISSNLDPKFQSPCSIHIAYGCVDQTTFTTSGIIRQRNKHLQPVQYKNISNICHRCERIGHSPTQCTSPKYTPTEPCTLPIELPISNTQGSEIKTSVQQEQSASTSVSKHSIEQHNSYGVWTVLTHRRRKGPRDSSTTGNRQPGTTESDVPNIRPKENAGETTVTKECAAMTMPMTSDAKQAPHSHATNTPSDFDITNTKAAPTALPFCTRTHISNSPKTPFSVSNPDTQDSFPMCGNKKIPCDPLIQRDMHHLYVHPMEDHQLGKNSAASDMETSQNLEHLRHSVHLNPPNSSATLKLSTLPENLLPQHSAIMTTILEHLYSNSQNAINATIYPTEESANHLKNHGTPPSTSQQNKPPQHPITTFGSQPRTHLTSPKPARPLSESNSHIPNSKQPADSGDLLPKSTITEHDGGVPLNPTPPDDTNYEIHSKQNPDKGTCTGATPITPEPSKSAEPLAYPHPTSKRDKLAIESQLSSDTN
ncbi:hypothetical protein RJ640_024119 [Escallonia rubra]|uniref:DUF4283 domain-containing protein n=1 Tax=Escallonia rubra TaxID=112253 RepID=A0AA88QAK5_9ASTE|nr:hypothetical protein RJ640_024119 [Escallonia rubra]